MLHYNILPKQLANNCATELWLRTDNDILIKLTYATSMYFQFSYFKMGLREMSVHK